MRDPEKQERGCALIQWSELNRIGSNHLLLLSRPANKTPPTAAAPPINAMPMYPSASAGEGKEDSQVSQDLRVDIGLNAELFTHLLPHPSQ